MRVNTSLLNENKNIHARLYRHTTDKHAHTSAAGAFSVGCKKMHTLTHGRGHMHVMRKQTL